MLAQASTNSCSELVKCGKIAFDIELGRKLLVHENGNNDFGFHQGGACKIARIFRDILHHHYLPLVAAAPQSPVARGMRALGVKLPA